WGAGRFTVAGTDCTGTPADSGGLRARLCGAGGGWIVSEPLSVRGRPSRGPDPASRGTTSPRRLHLVRAFGLPAGRAHLAAKSLHRWLLPHAGTDPCPARARLDFSFFLLLGDGGIPAATRTPLPLARGDT